MSRERKRGGVVGVGLLPVGVGGGTEAIRQRTGRSEKRV